MPKYGVAMSQNFKNICACQMCGSKYQMGPQIYEGKHIVAYDLDVCQSCYDGNWDGWAPHYEGKLLAHLREKSMPVPERNEKGWFPRG
jgi:hypothetical protein